MPLGSAGGYYEKVTVIIPVYNTEKYVGKCIESVVNQSYTNLEIILINDGSTDRSTEICAGYEKEDDRVWLFEQPNSGVSAARNLGLDLATGEYVLFIDSDDWLESNMIEILVQNMVSKKVDISCCQYDYGNKVDSKSVSVWNRDRMICEFLQHKQINGALVNKLFKRELIGDIRLDPTIKYGEDALFLWKNLIGVDSVAVSEEVLYHVTLHDDSSSGGGFKPIRMQSHIVWQRICQDAKQMNPEHYQMAKAQLGKMAFDSWLMMMISHYENREYEKECRILVRGNLRNMFIAPFIKNTVKACSWAFSYFPGITRQIMTKRYM